MTANTTQEAGCLSHLTAELGTTSDEFVEFEGLEGYADVKLNSRVVIFCGSKTSYGDAITRLKPIQERVERLYTFWLQHNDARNRHHALYYGNIYAKLTELELTLRHNKKYIEISNSA